jgi:hypothetical protein
MFITLSRVAYVPVTCVNMYHTSMFCVNNILTIIFITIINLDICQSYNNMHASNYQEADLEFK